MHSARKITVSSIILIFTVVFSGMVFAQDDTAWICDVNNWSNFTCWDNGEPNGDIDAIIDNGGIVEVNQLFESCNDLYLGNSLEGTLRMLGGTLDVIGDINDEPGDEGYIDYDGGILTVGGNINARDMRIGINNTGVAYTQADPQITVLRLLDLGSETSGGGTYTKNSTNILDTGYLRVGTSGTGTFEHNSGTVDATYTYLGLYDNGFGFYNLNNPGCLFDASILRVGYYGWGMFNQDNGTVSVGNIYLGDATDGYGEYNLLNGNITGNDTSRVINEYVGDHGQGIFDQQGGTNMVVNLYVGYHDDGQYFLSGGDLNASIEYIGWTGNGAFIQDDGSNLTPYLFLYNYGGTSRYELNGGNLRVNSCEYINQDAQFIQNGGNHTTHRLYCIDSPIYNLNNGQFDCNEEWLCDDTAFTQNGGAHNVRSMLFIGRRWYGPDVNTVYQMNGAGSHLTVGDPCETYVAPWGFYYDDAPGCEYIGFSGKNWHDYRGTFEHNDGQHRVHNHLLIGWERYSNGRYLQTDGQLTVDNDLLLGVNATSTGEYRLGPAGQLNVSRDEFIGWGSAGTMVQTGGANNCARALEVGLHLSSNGLYQLDSGAVDAQIEAIAQNGHFLQNGGINQTGKLFLGRFVGFKWGLNWGWWPWAPPDPAANFRIARYTKTGGQLRVQNPLCAYIGNEGPAVFGDYGGRTTINGTMHIGGDEYKKSGQYTLDNNDVGIVLDVNDAIEVGTFGRFEWFDGEVNVPELTLMADSTLAIGFDFNLADLRNGSLLAHPYAEVNGLDDAILEVTNGATAQSSATDSLNALRVGSLAGNGYFSQNYGDLYINYLEIDQNGLYTYGDGSLTITNGGLNLQGEMAFGSSSDSLDVTGPALVNLSGGQIINPQYASIDINNSNALTIVPPGFDGDDFDYYNNQGREHTAGYPLNVYYYQNYMFSGRIDDRVICSGSLESDGYLNLLGGLELSSGGQVNLAGGVVAINDSNSWMHGEPNDETSLAATAMVVDTGGEANARFRQEGGEVEISGDMIIGYDQAGQNRYELDEGGMVNAGSIYVAFDGNAVFDHNVGDVEIEHDLYVGYGPQSRGEYICWAVTSNVVAGFAIKCEAIGYQGHGVFTQHNGTNKVGGSLDLGLLEGSKGRYKMYNGNLETDELNIGVAGEGSFEVLCEQPGQCGEPNIVVRQLLTFGPNSVVTAESNCDIHMIGADVRNQSTDPCQLTGLDRFILTFEGGADEVNEFEVACLDHANDLAGYNNNFALGGLVIGGSDVGRLRLVDEFDNQPDSNEPEAVYVKYLYVGPYSELDLNGLNLYYGWGGIDPNAVITKNGGTLTDLVMSDIYTDGKVDFYDFAKMAEFWMVKDCGSCGGAELTGDGNVNLYDMQILVGEWLQ